MNAPDSIEDRFWRAAADLARCSSGDAKELQEPRRSSGLVNAASLMDQVVAGFEKARQLAPYKDDIKAASHWADRLNAIRAYYREYERLHGYDYKHVDPYESGLWEYLTPIEDLLWQDIRCGGRMPMVMQYPVGQYVLDFASPAHRVALEADGKKFHDPERDLARDTTLWEKHRWKVYRVTGSECHRILPSPTEFTEDYLENVGVSPDQDEIDEAARAFYMTTSTGVCRAIRHLEMGEPDRYGCADWAARSLSAHRLARFPVGDE